MNLEEITGMNNVGKYLVPLEEYVNTYNDGYERIDRGRYKILAHYLDNSVFSAPHYFEIEDQYGQTMIIKDDDAIDVLDSLY